MEGKQAKIEALATDHRCDTHTRNNARLQLARIARKEAGPTYTKGMIVDAKA